MDPKIAWGPEVFSGGGEGRGLASPLRQKQALEEEDGAKGPRYGLTRLSLLLDSSLADIMDSAVVKYLLHDYIKLFKVKHINKPTNLVGI